jgi:hypothetical protein
MSEVNEHWVRNHRYMQRLTGAGAASSAVLWLLSFYASIPAGFSASAHEAWFGFASIVTFVGAVGVTIGVGIGVAALLTDDPPTSGANR